MTPTAVPDPAQYGALRHGFGARPLQRDVIDVQGPDAAAYLDGQCSQDLTTLAVGDGTWSLVLEPDGKLCVLVAVARTADDRFVLATEAGFGERLTERLVRFKLRTKADIAPLPWQAVGVRGSQVKISAAPAGAVAVPFAVGGWAGWDIIGEDPAARVGTDALWCEEAAWEACRVESGIPVIGRELDERTIAPEAGLVSWTVSLTKGCYTGQELVARLDARGNRVARRLSALVFDTVDGVVPGELTGAVLHDDAREVGRVTSAAWCPAVDGVAALAMVHRATPEDAEVEVHETNGDVHRARVAALPLSDH